MLTNIKTNPLANEKYAVLIGHSHGGNVNKLVKRKLPLGDRNYFLSSHTNNNLVTVTDKKIP